MFTLVRVLPVAALALGATLVPNGARAEDALPAAVLPADAHVHGRTPLPRQVAAVPSADRTPIAFECAGSGPELLIVHGGTGDRTRWTPMFPYLEREFTVCAMDRRAHGQSGDGPAYALDREIEDVLAVVASRAHPVAVVGHSFGGVLAYEAALRTTKIRALVLYEPPLRVEPHEAVLKQIDELVAKGDRTAATEMFMREVVGVSPEELAAMRARPSWQGLSASVGTSVRQHRALAAYRWDAERAKRLQTPGLLLFGERTASPELKGSAQALQDTVPNLRRVELRGQEHNAMDTGREQLARAIVDFMRDAR